MVPSVRASNVPTLNFAKNAKFRMGHPPSHTDKTKISIKVKGSGRGRPLHAIKTKVKGDDDNGVAGSLRLPPRLRSGLRRNRAGFHRAFSLVRNDIHSAESSRPLPGWGNLV